MTKKKTNSEFKKEIYDLVGNEYKFLDAYVNIMTKIRVRHNKCGNVYEVRPNDFIRGNRCPYCAISAKKTNAQFKREVYALVGNEYKFLDDYVNNYTKLRVKHNECGYVYKVMPSNFLRGSRCPCCCGTLKKTDADFKKEVFDLVGNEYEFLDSYANARTKLRVKHNRCGKIYKVRPYGFLGHHARCPYCNGGIMKNDTQFKQEIFDLVGNEYVFLDSYINAYTKIRVKHNKCGKIYKVRPTDFLDHHERCPYCNNPKGELIINKILKSIGVEYKYQKTFPDLRDTQPLSYDFYIPDQAILIEYQGIQHYQPVDHFGGEDQFKLQQKHDKMKSDYAKVHHYNLIAVPYTEDTLSKIKKYLIKHGLTR